MEQDLACGLDIPKYIKKKASCEVQSQRRSHSFHGTAESGSFREERNARSVHAGHLECHKVLHDGTESAHALSSTSHTKLSPRRARKQISADLEQLHAVQVRNTCK